MNAKNPYQAYTQANHTVAKTRQVVMLYDGVIRNLQQAREAMEANRIEERYNKLVRASEIIMGLQMSLDFDQGQEAAQVLYEFYSSIDSRIMQLHRTGSREACDTIIDDIRQMRDIWNKIDKGEVAADGSVETHIAAPQSDGLSPAAALEAGLAGLSGTGDTGSSPSTDPALAQALKVSI